MDLELQKTKIADLEPHVAGMICYVPVMMVNYIAPPLFLFTEPSENTYVRFHAFQSLLVTAAWFAAIFLSFVAFIGIPIVFVLLGSITGADEIFALLAGLFYFGGALLSIATSFAGLIVHVVLALLTATKKNPKLPILGSLAARLAGYEEPI